MNTDDRIARVADASATMTAEERLDVAASLLMIAVRDLTTNRISTSPLTSVTVRAAATLLVGNPEMRGSIPDIIEAAADALGDDGNAASLDLACLEVLEAIEAWASRVGVTATLSATEAEIARLLGMVGEGQYQRLAELVAGEHGLVREDEIGPVVVASEQWADFVSEVRSLFGTTWPAHLDGDLWLTDVRFG